MTLLHYSVADHPPPPPIPQPLPRAKLTLRLDGRDVQVDQGATILGAARMVGVDIPTACYLEGLTPVNACRVCVVEVQGARALVPACSRKVEDGMVVDTDSPRVRLARRLVLELLASSAELSAWEDYPGYAARYGVDPGRFGPPAESTEDRDQAIPGHHAPPTGAAATVAQAVKVDNDCYVRDYSRCILCYRCVEACGEDAQHTFAIAVAGRGFDARISTEWDVPLPSSACVYCGNCVGVCPTGALQFRSEFELRRADAWEPSRQRQVDTICPYCGVGCDLTLHVQDDRIVKVTSPLDHSVTRGSLCVKGRFGVGFVHAGDTTAARPGDGQPTSEGGGDAPGG